MVAVIIFTSILFLCKLVISGERIGNFPQTKHTPKCYVGLMENKEAKKIHYHFTGIYSLAKRCWTSLYPCPCKAQL